MPVVPDTSLPTSSPATGGYGRLARRIGGWTANLLATAIVVVASIGLGRQVLIWWNEESPGPVIAIEQPAGAGVTPDVLPADMRLWTERGPLEIARVFGDRTVVLDAMRRKCQAIGLVSIDYAEAGPGERRFLDRLAKLAPVEQTGDLDLFAPDDSVMMVVAVSRQRRRIAAWSFALPVQEATWSCYTFGPAASKPAPWTATEPKVTP